MIGAALALALQTSEPDLARFAPLPRDVVAFIERRTGCNHFAGEFNGDRSARDREVTRVMRELRCARLDADEARLPPCRQAPGAERPDRVPRLAVAPASR